MSFDVAAFRQEYPEYGDSLRYPDDHIAYWGSLAEKECGWTNHQVTGQQIYVAYALRADEIKRRWLDRQTIKRNSAYGI